jgi:hypothetical protein
LARVHGSHVPGSERIPAVLGTIVFVYGGAPFLRGGLRELRDRQPGMMLLISLAIVVAFGSSLAAEFGWLDLEFWWELALLIDVMLLGHWQEMKALGQASRALDALAALLPDEAEVVVEGTVRTVMIRWKMPLPAVLPGVRLDVVHDGVDRYALGAQPLCLSFLPPHQRQHVTSCGAHSRHGGGLNLAEDRQGNFVTCTDARCAAVRVSGPRIVGRAPAEDPASVAPRIRVTAAISPSRSRTASPSSDRTRS